MWNIFDRFPPLDKLSVPLKCTHRHKPHYVPRHIMWHLDFVQRWIDRGSTFTLILIDDHSRFVVGHGVDDAERPDLVLDTIEQAVAHYGRPDALLEAVGEFAHTKRAPLSTARIGSRLAVSCRSAGPNTRRWRSGGSSPKTPR